MRANRLSTVVVAVMLACLFPAAASAVVTVYFNPGQVATPVDSGVTSDEIRCSGYLFTYTRDKLFTGGGPEPIGRPVRIAWPAGIEAQYVTTGPNPTKAQIRIRRVDGGVFDLSSFTAKLLANAGAGRAIEIVPLLNGEEPLNDPLYFDVSGNYGNSFSYDTSPNPLGSTAGLVGYDEYLVNLTLDYALTALTLTDASEPVSVEPEPSNRATDRLELAPNPARGRVRITSSPGGSVANERLSVYTAQGARVRSLAVDAAGVATWELTDDVGHAVPAGIYFVRREGASRPSTARPVVVIR